jgi:hypothetical protein
MRLAARYAICAVAFLLIGGGGGVRAQEQSLRTQPLSAQPPDIQAFVKQYVTAWNAKDLARLYALNYSKSDACITPASKDFYDGSLAMQMRDSIPANYTVTVSAVNEGNLKAIESLGRFPVKPARELHIYYQQGDDGGTVTVYLVKENGRWTDDFPCASEQSIKEFRDDAPENARLLAHYKALADGIKEPLRSELVKMLRAHETGSAIERYYKASGRDRKTSMYVINALKEETR